MFATNDTNNTNTLKKLFAAFKKYLELQKQYTKLELTEKLTILLSTFILILGVGMLSIVALFYFTFALAFFLASWVGLVGGFAIVGCLYVVLSLVIVRFRKPWIINPVVNFLAGLFFDKTPK